MRARTPLPAVLAVAFLLPLVALAAFPGWAPDRPAPVQGHETGPGGAPGAPRSPGKFGALVCPGPSLDRPLEFCNVRASARSGPANEIDLAMDASDPLHMVLVAKAYNYTRTFGNGDQPNVITSFATTFDGGLTWHEGFLQDFTPHANPTLASLGLGASSAQASDPVVEILPDGRALAVVLELSALGSLTGDLPVFRSEDGGITWALLGLAFDGDFADKEWSAVDPVSGAVYVATSGQHAGEWSEFVVRSDDGGSTWTAPVKLPAPCCFLLGLDVGANGTVHASGLGGAPGRLTSTRSLDTGQTWSVPILMGEGFVGESNPLNARLFRTPQIVQLAASHTDGKVFAVAAQRPSFPGDPACYDLLEQSCILPTDDVVLLRSLDGGLSWEAPVRINDDPTDAALQFMPQVAVSPNGMDVHVAWLDQRHDPSGLTAVVYYAHSPDGGATWEPNLLVSDAPFLVAPSHHQGLFPFHNGVFLGDYIGLKASDDRAVIAFPDTRYGRADVFIATIV